MIERFFKLYANCLPVKGVSRSVICDLQRQTVLHIPNDLYDIVTIHWDKSIEQISSLYGIEDTTTIEEYFSFLYQAGLLFYCSSDELHLFPKLNMNWDSPAIVTNAIIDIGYESDFDLHCIITQLEELGCSDLQLRFFKNVTVEEVTLFLYNVRSSSIKSIEIYVLYSPEFTEENAIQLINTNLRVSNLVIYSSDERKTIFSETKSSIQYVKQFIKDETHCGFISTSYFEINIDTFMEGQRHNSCLNRKISIDRHGNIKNCPSMKQSYGNIKLTTLVSVVEDQPEFKSYWHINKNQIKTCQVCEYRYVCTDCRAYLKDQEDLYSKPLKCSYDPYTNTWG